MSQLQAKSGPTASGRRVGGSDVALQFFNLMQEKKRLESANTKSPGPVPKVSKVAQADGGDPGVAERSVIVLSLIHI